MVGGVATRYQYNPDAIRTSQADATSITRYLIDGNRSYAQVLAETGDDSEVVTYNYGDDLISQNRDGAVHFFHADGCRKA